jgi:hypothetical protein
LFEAIYQAIFLTIFYSWMALDFLEFFRRQRNGEIALKASNGADFEHLSVPIRIASDSRSCGRPLRQFSI